MTTRTTILLALGLCAAAGSSAQNFVYNNFANGNTPDQPTVLTLPGADAANAQLAITFTTPWMPFRASGATLGLTTSLLPFWGPDCVYGRGCFSVHLYEGDALVASSYQQSAGGIWSGNVTVHFTSTVWLKTNTTYRLVFQTLTSPANSWGFKANTQGLTGQYSYRAAWNMPWQPVNGPIPAAAVFGCFSRGC